MEKQSHLERYKELIESYLELKVVLFNLKTQNNNIYPEAILNEIRALNDHIARCYLPSNEDIDKELRKAEDHLERLTFDTFKQVNIIFHVNINTFEAKYYNQQWLTLDNGRFWKKYCELRKGITDLIEKAKSAESYDSNEATKHYQDAYIRQDEVKELIEQNRKTLKGAWINKCESLFNSQIAWLLTTIVLAVVPALLWEVITHWNAFCSSISSTCTTYIKTFGEWLINI